MGRTLLCLLLAGQLIVLQALGREHFTRKITATLNPDCPETLCSDTADDDEHPPLISVVHVRAAGPADVIHHVWDFTGKPTVLVARTTPNASLSIDWPAFMDNQPDSVRFDERPLYTTAVVLSRLLQYNDRPDIGYLRDTTNDTTHQQQLPIRDYDLRNCTWRRQRFEHSGHHAQIVVVGTNAQWFGASGAVRLQMTAFGRRQYDVESPHQLHSENGTQVGVVLDKLPPLEASGNDTATAGRFAIELVHLASEPSADAEAVATDAAAAAAAAFTVQRRRSLDDEHTPGVFDLIDVVSPAALAHSNGSYVHYRPVSYTSAERDMGTSTDVHVQRPHSVVAADEQLGGSLAWSYYGYAVNRQLVQAYNVSLGRSGDGFYAKSGWCSWTFEMGYGVPPEEQMSLFVVIVASVGLVLPVVLLLSGGMYICVKRLRARRQRQREDEFY